MNKRETIRKTRMKDWVRYPKVIKKIAVREKTELEGEELREEWVEAVLMRWMIV